MVNLFVKAIILLALPVIVFLGGAYIMSKLSGREHVTQQLGKLKDSKDRKPIGLRFFGYDLGAVSRHWRALDEDALKVERRALEIDLVFPFFYGAAFAVALLLAWATLGRPFHPVWLMAPVAITVVADWIENLVQLWQLQLHAGGAALHPGWIQIASAATIVKLWLFCGSYLLVACLVVWMVIRAWPRSPVR